MHPARDSIISLQTWSQWSIMASSPSGRFTVVNAERLSQPTVVRTDRPRRVDSIE